jgi:hypothetical protein
MVPPPAGNHRRFKFGSEGGTRARDSRPYGANGDRKRLGDLKIGELTQGMKQERLALAGVEPSQGDADAVVIFGLGTRARR